MPALTIKHNHVLTIGDMTGTITVFNSAGTTTTANATDLVLPSDWNTGHNATISMSASDIASLFNFGKGLSSATDSNGITVSAYDVEYFEPFPLANTNTGSFAPANGSWFIEGFNLPMWIESGRNNWLLVDGGVALKQGAVFTVTQTGSVTKYQTFMDAMALYQLGVVSTTRIESQWSNAASILMTQRLAATNATTTTTGTSSFTLSNYATLSLPAQWDNSGNVTYSTFSTSGSSSTTVTSAISTLASTWGDNLISGLAPYITGSKMDVIPFNTALVPGQYFLGHMLYSTSSTTGTNLGAGTMMPVQSRIVLSEYNDAPFKQIGKSTTNSSTNVQPFHGYLATTSSAASSIINLTDLRGTINRVYWNHFEDTLS